MRQEVVLALLAKEPSHGYELRARLRTALGPLGDSMNAGQIYVTLTRLENAGLVTSERPGLADQQDRKTYALTADAVGNAHQADLAVQGAYGVDYKQYWFDEGTGKVFCLVEAPDADSAIRVHREAHGLVADQLVQVQEGH